MACWDDFYWRLLEIMKFQPQRSREGLSEEIVNPFWGFEQLANNTYWELTYPNETLEFSD